MLTIWLNLNLDRSNSDNMFSREQFTFHDLMISSNQFSLWYFLFIIFICVVYVFASSFSNIITKVKKIKNVSQQKVTDTWTRHHYVSGSSGGLLLLGRPHCWHKHHQNLNEIIHSYQKYMDVVLMNRKPSNRIM